MVRGFGGMIQTEEEIAGRRTCPIAAPSLLKSYMDCLGIKLCPTTGMGRQDLIFSGPTSEERITVFFKMKHLRLC
jgi:hypothetical protein